MQENLKRNFFWNTLGSLSYYLAIWLISMWVLRLVGTGVSGIFNTAFTVTNTFVTFSGYGMRTYQVADLQGKNAFKTYLVSRFISCGCSVLVCIIIAFVVPYSFEQRLAIILCLIYRLQEPAGDVLDAECQKNGRLDISGKSYVMRSITTILPFFVGLAVLKSLNITLILMAVFSWGVVLLYDLPYALKFKTNKGSTNVFSLLKVCAPLAFYAMLGTAAASVPKLFLERVLGADKLGIFAPVTAPVLLLQTCATYLFTPFTTSFSVKYHEKDKVGFTKLTLRVSLAILALLPLGLFVAIVLGKWGLVVFVGEEYAKYAYLLVPMVLASVLTAFVLFASILLTILQEFKGLVIANIVALCVSCIICVPLLKFFDMQGATYASIVSLAVQIIILIFFGLKKAKKHFE